MPRDGINKQAIAKMMRDIQREFDKHPIPVPVETDGLALPTGATFGSTVYNGPVFHGDANGAQLAWGNQTVNQIQAGSQQIAPGFEAIAQAVVRTMEGLPAVGLSEQDQQDAAYAGREILTEVTEPEPDSGKIRRALSALKGLLAPVAVGLAAGTAESAQEWARTAIEQLGTPPSSRHSLGQLLSAGAASACASRPSWRPFGEYPVAVLVPGPPVPSQVTSSVQITRIVEENLCSFRLGSETRLTCSAAPSNRRH